MKRDCKALKADDIRNDVEGGELTPLPKEAPKGNIFEHRERLIRDYEANPSVIEYRFFGSGPKSRPETDEAAEKKAATEKSSPSADGGSASKP